MSRRTATELFRFTLVTDGAFPPEAAGDFLDLILSAFPPKSKASGKKFVPAEFPGELEEQVLDDIRAIAADNPSREAALAAAPPPSPDAKAQEVARAAEAVRAAVRACFVGMRLKKPEVQHIDFTSSQIFYRHQLDAYGHFADALANMAHSFSSVVLTDDELARLAERQKIIIDEFLNSSDNG